MKLLINTASTFKGGGIQVAKSYLEEFRKNQTRDVEEPKQIETAPIVNNVVSITSDTKRMDEIKNASASNNALKLKRNKPLKRNHNNLESALGLIITPKS